MLTTWLDPPIVPHLEIHLYNITNPQEVTQLLTDRKQISRTGKIIFVMNLQ